MPLMSAGGGERTVKHTRVPTCSNRAAVADDDDDDDNAIQQENDKALLCMVQTTGCQIHLEFQAQVTCM
jgi:hypothetical protein